MITKTMLARLIIILLFLTPILTLAQSKNIALARSLRSGMRGEDVKSLQRFLAEYPDVYPEASITGFFGPKTEVAVKKWQKKNGLEAVGIVGPKTIAKIKEIRSKSASETPKAADIANGTNTAPAPPETAAQPDTTPPTTTLTLKAAAPAKIYIQTNPSEEVMAVYEYGLNINYGSTQEVSSQYFSSPTGTYIENLTPSTRYQVRAKVTDKSQNIGYSQNYTFTTPSLDQAPVLSTGPSISPSDMKPATSVAVSWETNIPCTGTLYYGGSAAFGNAVSSGYETNHNVVITGLGAGAVYVGQITCATKDKTLTGDNFIFTATSSASSTINTPPLANIFDIFNNILNLLLRR